MATTSTPQLNKEWFKGNMDREWTSVLANVLIINEDVLLRYLVQRVSHIHRSEKAAKKTKSKYNEAAHMGETDMSANGEPHEPHVHTSSGYSPGYKSF